VQNAGSDHVVRRAGAVQQPADPERMLDEDRSI
jgi:hypothetical protein